MTPSGWRTARRVFLAAAVLVGLAIVVVLIGVYPREPLRRVVESRLRATFGPSVSVRALHVVPGALRADIDELVVETATYRLEIPRLEAVLRARMLYAGGIRLRSLVVRGPILRIKAPDPNAPKTTPARIPALVISALDVKDASLIVELAGENGTLESRGIRASGSVGEATLLVEAPSIAWTRQKAVDLGKMTARLATDPGLESRLEELAYSKGQSQLKASGELGALTDLRPNIRFEGPVHLADLSELAELSGLSNLRGDASFKGRLVGSPDALELSLEGNGRGVGVADIDTQSIDLTAEHKAGTWTAKLAMGAFGGRIEATGTLQQERTEGRATLDGVAFESLPSSVELPRDLRGRISGNLAWNGSLEGRVGLTSRLRSEASYGQPIRANADLTGAVYPKDGHLDLRFTTTAGTRSGSLEAEGTAKGTWPPTLEGAATIVGSAALGAAPQPLQAQARFVSARSSSSVEIEGTFLGGTFEGGGRLVRSRIEDVKLSASGLELRRVDSRVRGTAKLELTASGAAAKPSIDAGFSFARVGYEKADLGDASATLQGTAAASRWTLSAPAMSLTGSGQLTTGKAGALTGTLAAERAPLAALAPLLPEIEGLEGIASAKADIRVPLDAPAKTEVAARFTVLEGRATRFGPVKTQPFSIRYGAQRVELRDFRAEAPGARAWIDGDFGLAGSRTFSGKARLDVDLAEVEPRLEGIAGRIGVDVSFDGVADRPIVTGAVSLKDVTLEHPERPRVRVADGAIRIENSVAVAQDLKLELDGGVLVLAGRVPVPALVASWRADPKRVAPDEAADMTLRWEGFDAGVQLARLRPSAENSLAARLSGSLSVRGGLAGLGEIDALLASQAADLAVGDVNGRLEAFEVLVARGRATTEGIQVGTAGGTFRLSGVAGIASDELDLTGRGRLDLSVLSPLLADIALTGTADVDARVTGTMTAPDARGSFTVSDATARFRVLTQALTGIQASVILDRTQARLERASAVLGGGHLTATGTLALSGGSIGAVDVVVKGQDIALRYPEGLRSRLEADLRLTGRPGSLLLAGEVRTSRALYDRDFQTSGFLTAVTVKDSPLLRSVALDLDLDLRSPLRVRNDTARLEATGRLKVRGDMQSPSPFGRFEVVAPGGELILLGARYAINRGTITYNGSWDPQIDIEVQRRIRVRQGPEDFLTVPGDYTATIAARGTVSEITREVFQLALGGRVDDRTETLRFSAEGPGDLDPSDVGYLALIGRRRSEIRGARLAGEQTGTLLASQLARKIQRGLPFENITIQPELVSRETAEPDARFTFGAALTDGVDLTYSLSLTTPEDKLIQLEGRTLGNFTALVKREYDLDERSDVLTVGGGQRFELGGAAPRRRTRSSGDESVVLSEVKLQGIADPALEKPAKDAIEARVGKKATAWTVQDDSDRIRDTLLKRGYIDVEVGADLEGTVATFDVRTGRPYVTRTFGMLDPPDLAEVLRESLYEEEALEKGRSRILEELFEKGHWRAKVEAAAKDEGQTRVLSFAVEPGPVLKLGSVTFPGATAFTHGQLLAAAGGPGALVSAPQEARTAIRKEYEKIHHLQAQVFAPRVIEQGGEIDIEVKVEEGPQSLLTQVVFEGASRPEAELLALSRLQPGMPYDEEKALLSVDAIRDDYYRNGWASARVYASHEDSPEGIVFTFHVDEGRRLRVGEVQITGLQRVRESFVRQNIDLKPGDPVDPARLGRMERRLLALTVFSRVSSRFSDDDPSLITVEVQERARFGAGYDVRYNETEQLAGVLDGEMRNLFGRGVSLGARYQGSRTIDKLRGTFFVPSFLWRGDLHASVFREQEQDFGEGDTDVTRLQRGFQLQESIALSSRTNILFGYRFARTRVTSPLLAFPSTQGVASLNLSGIRDTRDDVLDAKTGRFLSANLTLAPARIGSDQNYVKGLAQAFLSFPVGRRMTWAQGYRLGLAHVFGGEPLLSTEGFRAGGPNTIRGLKADALEGGLFGSQGLIILNQELRYRTQSGIGGAVFYDAGQVFPTIRDFDFKLRHAVGAGLRYASPFGLVRVDLGFPLRRREGEKRLQVHFSLGQAF